MRSIVNRSHKYPSIRRSVAIERFSINFTRDVTKCMKHNKFITLCATRIGTTPPSAFRVPHRSRTDAKPLDHKTIRRVAAFFNMVGTLELALELCCCHCVRRTSALGATLNYYSRVWVPIQCITTSPWSLYVGV